MGISLVPEDAIIPPENSEKSARLASQVKRIDAVAKFRYKNLTLPSPVLNPSVAKYCVIHAVFIMSNPFLLANMISFFFPPLGLEQIRCISALVQASRGKMS